MDWNDKIFELSEIFADLYPQQNQSYRIVDRAGIPRANINFQNRASDNWYNILTEAKKQDKVADLVKIVASEYPHNKALQQLNGKTTQANPTIETGSAATVPTSKNYTGNVSDAFHQSLQPAEQTQLDFIKSLLGKSELKKAIDALEEIAKGVSTDCYNDVIHQSGRYYRIVKDQKNGLITFENYQMTIAQISYALTSLIDNIPQEQKLMASFAALKHKNVPIITPPIAVFEKVFGKETLFEIDWLDKALIASKSICKVETNAGLKGTGFILKGGYLLTNHHVLEDATAAANAQIIFNYRRNSDGSVMQTKRYNLDANTYISSSKYELDYALIKVDDSDGSLSNWRFLELETFQLPTENDKVNIIQHPEGQPMKIALPDKVLHKWKQYLFYVADTKVGSSGSPVFNQEWKVIALHHAGKKDDGGFEINDFGDREPSNRGILIQNILADLKAKNVDAPFLN
ncbi:MAG: trypsin-like peptidase domain-containing protein [Flammeovirgaceae bacterium]